jgi:hypothetical protein
MTIRYFKATDGVFTVFRATRTRGFVSAEIFTKSQRVDDFIFSAASTPNSFPAVEIDKAEYDALGSLKMSRGSLTGIREGRMKDDPYQSWISNKSL